MANENMSDLYQKDRQDEENKIKKIVFKPELLKKHKRYFMFFTCLSILSLVDIYTHQMVLGLVSFFIEKTFGLISPIMSGAIVAALSVVFSFAILWIPISINEYFHIKKLEKARENK